MCNKYFQQKSHNMTLCIVQAQIDRIGSDSIHLAEAIRQIEKGDKAIFLPELVQPINDKGPRPEFPNY